MVSGQFSSLLEHSMPRWRCFQDESAFLCANILQMKRMNPCQIKTDSGGCSAIWNSVNMPASRI